jgi:hypothetical protein
MKLRLAVTALVYAAALSIGALIVTGHLSLTPFSGGNAEALALESETGGQSLLLCGGCYNTAGTYRVTVTVTVRPNYVNTCNWGCGNYNPCNWGCYQQPVYHYNPCSWGCHQQPVYNYNNWNSGCNWGCGNHWNNQYYLHGACHFNCNGRW